MKRPLVPEKNKTFIQRILIPSFFIIAGTLLVSSTILYYSFENIALGQVYRSDLSSLDQTSREIEDITEIAKSLTFQIYSDLTISRLLYYSDANVFDESAAMLQLRNYSLSMPFIESVYVYNSHTGVFYISSKSQRNGRQWTYDLDDRGILDIVNNYKKHLPYVPIPRTYTVGSEGEKTSSYTYLGYDNLSTGEKLDNAVIVNISEAWLSRNISGAAGKTGSTMIIDNTGRLLSGNINESLSHLPYIRELLGSSNTSGYFIASVNGTKSLISYTAPNELNWRYVKVTPYKAITSKITKMRMNTFIVSLSVLILGLILSFIISRKLYRPIDTILNKISYLEAERRNHKQVLKQDFLRNIILGRETILYPALHEKLNYYDVSLDIREPFRLVLIRIDGYVDFCRRNKAEEQQLMKFAIQNIAAEIYNPNVPMESVDMGEDCILLLCADSSGKGGQAHARFTRGEEEGLSMLQSALADYLKLSVSMTVSPASAGVDHLGKLYKQTYEASCNRLFHGSGCLLHAEPIMERKRKTYTYPIAKEKQIVEFAMVGKADDAKKLLSEVLDETGEYAYAVVQLALSHLSLTMNNMIHAIRSNNSFAIEAYLDPTIVTLQYIESLEEVKEPFNRLFDEVAGKLDIKRNQKHDELIRTINERIERDYANPDLSLNMIADKLGMSPAYISRLYKQFTLSSLTDNINDVRLRKAKELLTHTEIPVAEIAERSGFTTISYFFRIFKRTCSVTPNDYRKLHRTSD